MKRLAQFSRRLGSFLGRSLVAAVFAVAFIFLLLYVIDDPIPRGPTLQFSEACFGSGI